MLRKALIAIAACAALGAGVTPGIADMRGDGVHGDGFHEGHHGRHHDDLFRPGFRDHVRPGFREHGDGGYDFYHRYDFAPYANAPYGSCWQPRRVMTQYGSQWRRFWVCG